MHLEFSTNGEGSDKQLCGSLSQCGLGPWKVHLEGYVHAPSAISPSFLLWQLFYPGPSTSQLPLEQDLNVLGTWTFRLS